MAKQIITHKKLVGQWVHIRTEDKSTTYSRMYKLRQ